MTTRRPPPGSTLSETVRAGGLSIAELPESRCLSIDELLQLVQGEVSPTARDRALEHVDGCPDCQVLLAEAGAALQSSCAQPVQGGSRGVFDSGDYISNRYRVERFIAKGGMGEVYAVFDTLLGERVALKTVRDTSPGDSKAIRRLKSEVLLSRRIGHPNTCRIYEFGEHPLEQGESVCYFTMALITGETLGAKLRRDGALPAAQVAIACRQILAGLSEAHGLGILHRDLKSDNIMLRSPPTPGLSIDAVIMDFGLALSLDGEERLTSDSNAIVGSLAYMAPEQVAAEKLTPATDIYAFGVILFEMLTGRLPFRGATPAVAALQRLRQPPPAPSSVLPGLDPAWDHIVLGCLERAAEKRFASAQDVLNALAAVSARPPRRAARRWRLAVVAIGVVILAALAAWDQRRPHAAKSGGANRATAARDVATTTPALRVPEPLPAAPVREPPAPSPPVAAPPAPAPRIGSARAAAGTPLRSSRKRAEATDTSGSSAAPTKVPAKSSSATPVPGSVIPEPPRRRQPVGPLPVDPEFPE